MICLVALGVILLVLCLLAILPVGVDASYEKGTVFVFAKCGPLRLQILPWKRKSRTKSKADKTKKAKKQKKHPAQETAAQNGKRDYRSLIKIAVHALQGFRQKLCVNFLMLHYTAASDDPYDTVMQYGRISAAIGGLLPLARRVFHIKKEDIVLDLTFETAHPVIAARIVLTLRIWEIVSLAVRTLAELLRWKRRQRADTKPSPEKEQPPAAEIK